MSWNGSVAQNAEQLLFSRYTTQYVELVHSSTSCILILSAIIMDDDTKNLHFNEGETSYLAALLLFLEFYHFLGHSAVLLRLRMLPRKDLVRQK